MKPMTSLVVYHPTARYIFHNYSLWKLYLGHYTPYQKYTNSATAYPPIPFLHNIGGLTTDSDDFHRKRNDIIHLVAPESFILTMDDNSLYANIPHTDVSMHAAHFLAGTQLIQLR